jgi:hypothetical protein
VGADKKAPPPDVASDTAPPLVASGFRCQCTGQCGETHNWTPEAPVQACRAPHGVEIRRKTDSPSFWQINWGGDALLGGLYRKNVVTVDLRAVASGKEGEALAMCQRCCKLVTDRNGGGKRGAPPVTI